MPSTSDRIPLARASVASDHPGVCAFCGTATDRVIAWRDLARGGATQMARTCDRCLARLATEVVQRLPDLKACPCAPCLQRLTPIALSSDPALDRARLDDQPAPCAICHGHTPHAIVFRRSLSIGWSHVRLCDSCWSRVVTELGQLCHTCIAAITAYYRMPGVPVPVPRGQA